MHRFLRRLPAHEAKIASCLMAILLFATLARATLPLAAQEPPVIHAVLFYSSSCIHCQQVIQEVLPPLRQEFGPQLDLLLLDVANPQMLALFETACDRYAVEESLCGSVPTAIVGPHILIGSDKIAAQLTDLIRAGLAEGGIDLPALPGMQAAYDYVQSFRTTPSAEGAEPSADSAAFGLPDFWARLAAAPLENGLMLLVLSLSLGVPLLAATTTARPSPPARLTAIWRGGLLGLLALTLPIVLSLFEGGDPLTFGNVAAAANTVVLVGLGGMALRAVRDPATLQRRLWTVGLPALALGGMLLAGYLFYHRTYPPRSLLRPPGRLPARPTKPVCLAVRLAAGRRPGPGRLWADPDRLARLPAEHGPPPIRDRGPARRDVGLWRALLGLPDFHRAVRDRGHVRLVPDLGAAHAAPALDQRGPPAGKPSPATANPRQNERPIPGRDGELAALAPPWLMTCHSPSKGLSRTKLFKSLKCYCADSPSMVLCSM